MPSNAVTVIAWALIDCHGLCYLHRAWNSSGKGSSSADGPKFPGDKTSSAQNNNQQKKGIQVLPDGEAL